MDGGSSMSENDDSDSFNRPIQQMPYQPVVGSLRTGLPSNSILNSNINSTSSISNNNNINTNNLPMHSFY